MAQVVINNYGEFYPELKRNSSAILDNITQEERRFKRTVEAGVAKLANLLAHLQTNKKLTSVELMGMEN